MKIDFNKMTRRFLMGEGKQEINPHAHLQALKEVLSTVNPSTMRDENKIAIAKKHLYEITRSFRKLQEQVNVLEEKLQVLEEITTVSSIEGAVGGKGVFTDLNVEKENKKERERSKK